MIIVIWLKRFIGKTTISIMNLIIIYFILKLASANITDMITKDFEEIKMDTIVDLIGSNLNRKGWTNFIVVGSLPDEFFKTALNLPFTFVMLNDDTADLDEDDITPYRPNTVVICVIDFNDFEEKFNIARNGPYWHPHTNLLIYFHGTESNENFETMFFILWYHQCCNAIIVRYNDFDERFMITQYSPYISNTYKLDEHFGCWTRKKVSIPITNFQDGFICMEGCHNITTQPMLRMNYLGTCIGIRTHIIKYNDLEALQSISFFEDKGKNLHGFPLTAYTTELLPFIKVDKNSDGTYTLSERDGIIYTEMAKSMNFTIDLTPSIDAIKTPFDFKRSIERMYAFAQRKVDLIFMPLYLFDLVIVDVDMTVPFKDSGLCYMSHIADYETTLFDIKLFQSNYDIFLKFQFCFIGIWFIFAVFNAVDKCELSLNQVGKDLSNAIRSVLSLSLYKPPTRQSFRIFLSISIWCFFIMNFVTQAAIISFFSAYKRGKNVDTFDDIVEKGYTIEGLLSPDAMLPETEEKFKQINSKLAPISDLFSCVRKLRNSSQIFCLVDCSVGHYFERNQLDDKGEPYLHVANDQVHNHYLVMVLHKNSALTDQFNKYMLKFIEAGLIGKWEAYRYKDIKYEVPVKALGTDDLSGVFLCYSLLTGFTVVIFLCEVVIGVAKMLLIKCSQWYRVRDCRIILK